MFSFQVLLQRKRKLLFRCAAAGAIGLAGLLAVLPRADAHGGEPQVVRGSGPLSALLSPNPLSGREFAVLYPVTHS